MSQHLIPQSVMEQLRRQAEAVNPETIAVVVLAGSPESGTLAMTISSIHGDEETYGLLRYAVTANGID